MDQFEAYEIQIHTPAEHFYQTKAMDLEVQILHRSISGSPKWAANLSFLYKSTPGVTKNVFQKLDIMNLPNPKENIGKNVIREKLHPLNFLFDEEKDATAATPFNYYIYTGSQTQPPCAEYVYWIIADEQMEVSSSVIGMFMDSLIDPDSPEEYPVTSGNNRVN